MIIGIIKEQDKQETRTPLTPTATKELTSLGHTIIIEKDIGKKSYFSNQDYILNGARILPANQIYQKSDILIKFFPPLPQYLQNISPKQILITNFSSKEALLPSSNATIIQLEKTPRTSFYQNIDTLTSQALPRGYSASLFALLKSPSIAPLLFTPSASLNKSKALIIGASITGLEIASMFKKNGAETFILDTSSTAQELANSIGANFILSSSTTNISSLIKDKNYIISAVTSLSSSKSIISPKELKYALKGTIIVDTTSNNISIKSTTKITSTYSFYRNPYFERLCPKTASILYSSNIENIIKLLLPSSDSTPNFTPFKPMLYNH